ncbi:YdcF family protein [Brevundimonas sp. S30B]|uniref:YdcF family protein n=1 Tax=unclassified Brevundimonas TaxID=2622653 RepID=UPI0010721630|nr:MULTISPECIES: YdcF family protein [unclassified Brevundimonas]QBX38762.1 YdcF family protein [Brevundimonas sp. MF30-B]TFW01354.1 YdcF family protein [Brevundimonas sp. S30B]
MKFLALVGIVALMWLVGLFVFADRVRGLSPADEPARADAIVALTGPSAERVNASIRLLEQGKGDRLLISGVNREVRRQELRALTPGSSQLFNCCVDLGFEAEDTVGNAREIAAWARRRGYDSLIVVTSDYHMPRSLLEIRSALPGVRLTPYAVSTPSLDDSEWWRAAVTARRMTLEYMKYLTVLGREAGHRLRGVHPERAATSASTEAASE